MHSRGGAHTITAPVTEPVLTADQLNVRFGILLGKKALCNISFQLWPGEITCVIGPNGAGKTTLLNLLAGCLFKKRNHIKVFGRDRWKHNLEIRRQSTYVPATQDFTMGRTPMQHFQAMARLYNMTPDAFQQRCHSLVNDLSFAHLLDKPWEELSLGQTHKAMMIGGFLPPARLRILDEPVASGIDPLGMEILGVWMKESRNRGEAILFSTQMLDRAHILADRLIILGDGRLIFGGTPKALMQEMGVDDANDYALNEAFMKLFADRNR